MLASHQRKINTNCVPGGWEQDVVLVCLRVSARMGDIGIRHDVVL